MSTTVINVIEVKNTSKQPVVVGVRPRPDSPIFTEDGQIQIQPGAKLEVEDDRFNLAQLVSMQNNRVIQFLRTRRAVTVTEGSSGSGS